MKTAETEADKFLLQLRKANSLSILVDKKHNITVDL